MNAQILCHSLDEVRHHIDRLDRQMVQLLAQRSEFVRQAAGFKKTAAEVPAPARVAQVLRKVEGLAQEFGAPPAVAVATWQAMIGAFIAMEQAVHSTLSEPPPVQE